MVIGPIYGLESEEIGENWGVGRGMGGHLGVVEGSVPSCDPIRSDHALWYSECCEVWWC